MSLKLIKREHKHNTLINHESKLEGMNSDPAELGGNEGKKTEILEFRYREDRERRSKEGVWWETTIRENW